MVIVIAGKATMVAVGGSLLAARPQHHRWNHHHHHRLNPFLYTVTALRPPQEKVPQMELPSGSAPGRLASACER